MLKKTVILALLVATIFCQKVMADTVSENEVKAIIVKHAMELGVDPALGLSIAKNESKFRHNTRSPYGAVGVFQLLPSTARTMGLNAYYLSDNIRGGLMYYKMMYKMFGSTEKALAAYNAGPVAVKRNPNVSRGFVNTIMADYRNYKKNPDQSMIHATRKAPVVNAKPKPTIVQKPEVTSSPVVKGSNVGLSKHTTKMVDVEAKTTQDSLI